MAGVTLVHQFVDGHDNGPDTTVVRPVDWNAAHLLYLQVAPQGRLTLASATPVMTSDQAAKTTIFYTPHVGSYIPIFDGANWTIWQFVELSNATANSATGNAGPAVVANNSNYDLFVWNNGGSLCLTRGPAWNSDTARGAGAGTTELLMQTGVMVNANAITNGPGAGLGTYVGTVRSNGSAQIDWKLGTSAAGGGIANLGVWNAYNRVQVFANVRDSSPNYTYASATVRAADNSVTNRCNFVIGLAAEPVLVDYSNLISTAASAGSTGIVGVALDATNVADKRADFGTSAAIIMNCNTPVHHGYVPQLGFHFIQAVEATDGTTITFNSNTAYNGLNVQGFF